MGELWGRLEASQGCLTRVVGGEGQTGSTDGFQVDGDPTGCHVDELVSRWGHGKGSVWPCCV